MPEAGKKTVVVVGGCNVDIGGRPDHMLIEGDSNPGRVRITLGGVGHNIARNLRQLGADTVFLTAVGRDLYGERILLECSGRGIDVSRVLFLPDGATPTYLFITDREGEMRLAISDMAVCDRITPAYLAVHRDVLDGAAAVILDANLPEESIAYLAETCRAPLFADPVSAAKAGKLKPVLSRLTALKPNRLEAELLSGVTIRSEEDLAAAAERLLDTGLKEVYISLGSRGVFAAERGASVRQHAFPAEARNVTGAGDAFMAALVWAHLRGRPLEERTRLAAAAASLAVESEETVHPGLNPETLVKKSGGPDGNMV